MSLFIGFDIGGSTVRAGLVRLTGESPLWLAFHRQLLTPSDKPPERLVEVIAHTSRRLAESAQCTWDEITAIGIGLCGQLTEDGHHMVHSPHLGWQDVAIGKLLSRRLAPMPIALENDLNVILLGEHAFGAARGFEHVVAIFVGSGIGGATLLNGRLVRGALGFAGEVGHIKLGGDRPCRCGDIGCAETIAGGHYLESRLQADRLQGLLDPKAYGQLDRVLPQHVDAAYEQGDSYARRLWGEVSGILARLAASCVALLDPELVLLGGGVLEHCPALFSLLQQEIPRLSPGAQRGHLTVASAQLGNRAGVLGASIHARERSGW